MADILKITSPIPVKDHLRNLPKKQSPDEIFDITNPNQISKTDQKGITDQKSSSLQNTLLTMNKEMMEPFLKRTDAQANSMRKLVLIAKLFEVSPGVITEDFLDRLFVRPNELFSELLKRDDQATIFKGEIFYSLRMLANYKDQPELKDAIVAILKHFECYVKQDDILKAIMSLSERLPSQLTKTDSQILQQQFNRLGNLIQLKEEGQQEIQSFLKNVYIPLLGEFVKKYQQNSEIRDNVMAVIHQIVRFDKGDVQKLVAAVYDLDKALKPLINLTDDDVVEMLRMILDKNMKDPKEGRKVDIAELLSKALDKSEPVKLNKAAQNLMQFILQSESPISPIMHFMIPIKFLDETTYGEFFVDKRCDHRKGDATQAKNIFFTIQSDVYGTFEIDMLARDNRIDLDIKCPEPLLKIIKDTKTQFKGIVEEQGYYLMDYQVGIFVESQSILQRFPKIALGEVGIDVKI